MPDALVNVNGDSVQFLELLALTTILALLPSMLIMLTSFTRYIIVFSFLRQAMGTQQTPPNMVLVGIAITLSLFTMAPVISTINAEAYTPYSEGEISMVEFVDRAQVPLKEFMLRNTETSTMNMFCDLAQVERPSDSGVDPTELSMRVVIPSFITSELKRAFEIGFFLYIPFLLIDVIVSATLMSMGMIMLPPSMISMPFKLLLFIALNGWELLFSTLVQGFH